MFDSGPMLPGSKPVQTSADERRPDAAFRKADRRL